MNNTTTVRSLNKCLRSIMVPFFALSLVAFDVSAEIGSMGEAIDMSGRQRMLSQRIAQSYLQIGLQPEGAKAPKQLLRCIEEFDRNLQELKDFIPGLSLESDLRAVETLWSQYRVVAEGTVSQNNAALLLDQSNKVLAAAHTYVGKLQVLSGTKNAELINIAGRQRMLSQRIAKNFLAKHWGVTAEDSSDAFYEDLAEYENVLGYLADSEINTPEINTQLAKVKGQFKYSSKGFDGVLNLSNKRLIYVVTGSTDSMLSGMNKVTGMYAELLTD